MSQAIEDRFEILSEGWSGDYTMVCTVRVGGVVENVSATACSPPDDVRLFFDHDSEFNPEDRSSIGGALLMRYHGLE